MDEKLKHQTKVGVFWSAAQRFSTQGIQFLTTLFLARILTPTDYGMVGMLGIFIGIASVFVDSGFTNALTRKENRTHTDICTVFYFNVIVSIVAYFVLFVISPLVAKFYEMQELCVLLRVMGLMLIINSLSAVQVTLMTIALDFKIQTRIAIIALIISGVVGIAFAYWGFSYWALVVQNLLFCFVNTVLYWVYSTWRPSLLFSKQSFNEMFSFGSKLLAMSLIDTTYNNLYTIVIGKCFSANILGHYSRADSYANIPSSSLTGVMQRVAYPVLCKIQGDENDLADSYRKFIRLSAFVIFPLMLGLSALAHPFVVLIIGPKWTLCAIILQILCFALMWYPIHAINLSLLLVKGRSDLSLRLEVIKKIVGVLMLSAAIPMGIMGLCYSRIITSIVCLIINTFYTGKLIKLGFFQQMADLTPTFVISLAMWGLILMVNCYIPGLFLQMITGVCIGVLFYSLASFFFNRKDLNVFISLIR